MAWLVDKKTKVKARKKTLVAIFKAIFRLKSCKTNAPLFIQKRLSILLINYQVIF
jgi:hypothetical protein